MLEVHRLIERYDNILRSLKQTHSYDGVSLNLWQLCIEALFFLSARWLIITEEPKNRPHNIRRRCSERCSIYKDTNR